MVSKTLSNKYKLLFTSVLLVNLFACTAPNQMADSSPPPSPDNKASTEQNNSLEQYKISVNGMGPIKMGMSVAQASAAAGVKLIGYGSGEPAPNSSCSYVRPENGLPELDFMVNNDQIVRIDVRNRVNQEADGRPVWIDIGDKSRITTQLGAKLGDTEAQIKTLYPNADVTGHKYIPGGHYLIVTPQEPELANYRLIFETDGNQVTSIRSGRLPEVELVERCG